MQHGPLPEFVAASLAAHAAPLARHWLERAAAATPRPPVAAGAPDADLTADAAREAAERVVLAVADGVRGARAVPLGATPSGTMPSGGTLAAATPPAPPGPDVPGHAPSVHAVPVQDARPTAEVMRLGWVAGGAAYAAGHSVHHVVRDADLLLAVVLADLEHMLADVPPAPGAGAADGVAVARRVQRAVGRYAQAALSGFVHALLRGLRERYRLLRHDLRNPLGTIRSALSLMEDESVPVETRQGPNIRAMVARNAGSLDRLIGRRLDDASAAALLAPPFSVLVRDVALAARREVRDAARLAGCDVVVDVPADAPSRVDGAALELTLTTLLLAALARASSGDRVRVRCEDRVELRAHATGGAAESRDRDGEAAPCVVLAVVMERAGGAAALPEGDDAAAAWWDEQGLALALDVALDYGGRLGADAAVAPVRDAAALAAELARAPVVYLRLPLVEPGAAPEGAGARTPAASASHASASH